MSKTKHGLAVEHAKRGNRERRDARATKEVVPPPFLGKEPQQFRPSQTVPP